MVPEVRQSEEQNARAYAESQKQRKLERDLRRARLQYAVRKAQGADKEALKAEREKVRKADEKLDRFVEATGRKRRREREYRPVDAKWPEDVQNTAGSDQTPMESDQTPMESDQTPAESAQELAKSAQENPAAIQGEQVTESEEKALTDGDENGTIKAETWYEKNIAGNPEMEQKYQAALVKAKEESRMDGDLGSPSLPKNLSEYSFDKKHVNEERLHNVTREEAESYIREAVVRVVRNKGSYVNYYGLNGATYTLARQKMMRTSFPSSQYTPNIITLVEVMKRELGIE